MTDRWSELSQAPTRSGTTTTGPLTAHDLFADAPAVPLALDERLRQAYYWLVNKAVISPFYDVEFSTTPPLGFTMGDAGARFELASDQSYSSNVLLPLLTFAVGGRCLFIGGPGRGKTTLAVIMGVLAGSSATEVRRAVVQGQPQLTIAELVGPPLPKDLLEATSLDGVRVAWRDWLTRPVKIVDEYNRIPTKTQSALLTMVAEGYVESYDQILHTASEAGVDAWFFTANDDSGGGTFPVIQALRDRMDVTVAALGFNSRFLSELVARVEAGDRPEEHVPGELVFDRPARVQMADAIRAVPFPPDVLRRLEFFSSHFEFAQHGGRRFEYRTKDTVATAGGDIPAVIDTNSGADLDIDLGAQTTSSISVRALQVLIRYAKAMAWFRGESEVNLEDVRAVLPFVLRGKLLMNTAHPRFGGELDRELQHDSIAWLGELWDASNTRFTQLGLGDDDPVGRLLAESARGLDGVSRVEIAGRIAEVEAELGRRAATGKLYGSDFDDLLALKYLHQRYSSYRRWLDGAESA